jgi:hypothetical protein
MRLYFDYVLRPIAMVTISFLFGISPANIPEPVTQEIQENVQTFVDTREYEDITYIYLGSKGMGYEEEGLIVEKILKENKISGSYKIEWVPFGDANEEPEYIYEFIVD